MVAAAAAFGILALLFDSLRSPILRLVVALIFAAPAAVPGYVQVHGVTKEAVPSEIWRQIFCIIGGGFCRDFGLSATGSTFGRWACTRSSIQRHNIKLARRYRAGALSLAGHER